MLSYENLKSGGELSISCVVSVLIALYLRWRFLAFDFIMPNHQIVECYIVFTAMEAAKKSEDPDAGTSHTRASYENFRMLLQLSALI